ncbi:MAG: hypothetical protein JSU01_08980 [Bacteroidetes bacterium]|nr:hypothetical protein [Bacteroidota bacterium]
MKRNLLVILPIVISALICCKKDSSTKVMGAASDSYWPVTPGNSWTYRDATSMGVSNFTLTMTGTTRSINDKTYYACSSLKNGINLVSYIYETAHTYALRDTLDALGCALELQMCDDAQKAGYIWTMQPTDNGMIESVPTQTLNQVISTDGTLTANGQNYAHVIHTQVELQYDEGKGFETVCTYDFFLAKGIGMIELDTRSGRAVIESETLTDYSVK